MPDSRTVLKGTTPTRPIAPERGVGSKADPLAPGAGAAEALEPRAVLHEIDEQFATAIARGGSLVPFLGRVPRLESKATDTYDGRKVRLVVGVVHDEEGATRGGIEVRLVDTTAHMLDRTYTDHSGLFVLRFPLGYRPVNEQGEYVEPRTPREFDEQLRGNLLVAGQSPTALVVQARKQHALVDVPLATLPEPTPNAPIPNPLNRLPADFTMELCDDIRRLCSMSPDPILGRLAPEGDFRGERMPLIKRFTVPVVGGPPDFGRYLVRVRQEWMFAGYTLGEMNEVESLDPGMVLEERTESFRRSMSQTSRATSLSTYEEQAEVRSWLQRLASIDSLVATSQTASVQRHSEGYRYGGGGSAGFSFLGFSIGGGASGSKWGSSESGTSRFTANTRSSTDTSLRVNSYLHTARSIVNTQIRTAASTLHTMAVHRSREVSQVSPLLSRVTNLLRWTLYENYIVSTTVEDVVQVHRQRVAKPAAGRPIPWPPAPLFTADDIVEYRRYFEPEILEPRLLPEFDALQEAVAIRRSGGVPVRTVHVAVDYAAVLGSADLTLNLGGREIRMRLAPGDTEVRGTLVLPVPVKATELDDAVFEMKGIALPLPFGQAFLNVRVDRIRFWFNHPVAGKPEQVYVAGPSLKVSVDAPVASARVDLQPDPRVVDTTTNELFQHVRRNETHYFGVLLQAAYREPSLRSDSPHLRFIGADNALWKLPVLGFEGLDVLYLGDADDPMAAVNLAKDAEVARLLGDPGAATVIQLAAPGAYSEAVQGLLSLADAEGRIHPELLPKPLLAQPVTLTELTSPVTVKGELVGAGVGGTAKEKVGVGG